MEFWKFFKLTVSCWFITVKQEMFAGQMFDRLIICESNFWSHFARAEEIFFHESNFDEIAHSQ